MQQRRCRSNTTLFHITTLIKHSYHILLKLSVAWQFTMFRNLFSLYYCCKHFVNSLTPCYSFYCHYFSSDHLVSLWHEIVSWPWIIADVCWSLWDTVAGVTVMSRSVHLPDQGRKLWESFPFGYLSDSINIEFYGQGNSKCRGFFDHKIIKMSGICSMVHLAWNFFW